MQHVAVSEWTFTTLGQHHARLLQSRCQVRHVALVESTFATPGLFRSSGCHSEPCVLGPACSVALVRTARLADKAESLCNQASRGWTNVGLYCSCYGGQGGNDTLPRYSACSRQCWPRLNGICIDADTPTCLPRLLWVLPGRTDMTRLVAEAVPTRLLVLRRFACLQRCWPRRKDVHGSLAEALAHHRRSLPTNCSSRTSSSVICMCNASLYSETCSMLQSASRLPQL